LFRFLQMRQVEVVATLAGLTLPAPQFQEGKEEMTA